MQLTQAWQRACKRLDVMASNLANASTSGSKRRSPFTGADGGLEWRAAQSANQAIEPLWTFGRQPHRSQVRFLGSDRNRTDLAVEGSAYFSVETQAGIRLHAQWKFRTDSQRRLVTSRERCLGGAGENTTIPIVLPHRRRYGQQRRHRLGNGGLAAKLHMVEFAPGTPLTPEGNSNFAAPAGSEQTAADSTFAKACWKPPT